jgi:enoyl-[acyl-carrier-protein] reductase (NADH)
MFESECNKTHQTRDIVKSRTSLGRPAKVDEVGNKVVYLCSPAASYVNGIGLLVDAGLTLTLHLG